MEKDGQLFDTDGNLINKEYQARETARFEPQRVNRKTILERGKASLGQEREQSNSSSPALTTQAGESSIEGKGGEGTMQRAKKVSSLQKPHHASGETDHANGTDSTAEDTADLDSLFHHVFGDAAEAKRIRLENKSEYMTEGKLSRV